MSQCRSPEEPFRQLLDGFEASPKPPSWPDWVGRFASARSHRPTLEHPPRLAAGATRSSDDHFLERAMPRARKRLTLESGPVLDLAKMIPKGAGKRGCHFRVLWTRSEEHTSELQSRQYLVCRL